MSGTRSRRRRVPRRADPAPGARTEAGHDSADGRHPAGVHAALFCLRLDSAHRLRERRQPAAGARRRTAAGNRHPVGDWRVAPPDRLAAADRKPAAGTRVGAARLWHFTAGAHGCRLRGDHDISARHRQPSSRRAAGGLARRAVPGRRRHRLDDIFCARAGASSHARGAGAGRSRRGGARRTSRPRPGCARRGAGDGIGPVAHLRGDLPAQFVGRVLDRSRHPNGRCHQCQGARRAAARRYPRCVEQRAARRITGRLLAGPGGRVGRAPGVCGDRQRQVPGDLPVCVARVLRRLRRRPRARPRLQSGRAQPGRRGGDRVRHSRAPTVAGSRCARTGRARRAGSRRAERYRRLARTSEGGKPAAALALRRCHRRREGRCRHSTRQYETRSEPESTCPSAPRRPRLRSR